MRLPSVSGAIGICLLVLFVAMPQIAGATAILPGFNATTYGGNDDGSYPCTGSGAGVPSGCTPTAVSIGFANPINFFGNSYSSLYVNNNGNITFNAPLSTFTPFGLTTNIGTPVIAPFFADVDTRTGNTVTFGSGTVGGRSAFGANWPGVGYFSENTDKTNNFQAILIDRSDTGAGNFDIQFNYGSIQWETGGASGGTGGLGGSSARVGYSNGSGNAGTFFELPGSGVNGAFLDSNLSTGLINNDLNSDVLGRYIFSVRGGVVVSAVPEPSTVSLFAVGLAGLLSAARRRRHAS